MLDVESSAAADFSRRVDRFFQSTLRAVSGNAGRVGSRVRTLFDGLRDELREAGKAIAEHDKLHAVRFNVFEYVEPDENRLSAILAELLNPKGAHGQGDVFLLLFAERLKAAITLETHRAKVYCEETTGYIANPLRRIDIVIDFGSYGIGIENKPWAGEQFKQLEDYHDHLNRRYKGRFLLVYLSGSGELPESIDLSAHARRKEQNRFRFLDYRNGITGWLGDCILACQAESVKWFLRHFRGYVVSAFSHVKDQERING